MAFIDYYKILGVKKDIAQADVKKAYLKRAKQFHPDLHPDDPKAKAKFQALNEAYEVIGDAEKRRLYDQYGEQWREAGQTQQEWRDCKCGRGGGGGDAFGGFDFSGFQGGGFSSFFEHLFGNRGAGATGFGNTAAKPRQTEASISIDMYTALLGGDVVVALPGGQKLRLKVKPGTQPGQKVRLRGKGQDGNDLILTYQVTLPSTLSPRQRELLEQMRMA
ncbi:MAG: DnaJ domain-containing protein [Prevotella sp.]|nr:DnaJ domain-containing protein [Prevotella sp.]